MTTKTKLFLAAALIAFACVATWGASDLLRAAFDPVIWSLRG